MYTIPTLADFKAYFFRDFPYQPSGAEDLATVQDQDINNAFTDAGYNFNDQFASDQSDYTLLYLLLTAHFLVTNLQNSSQGIAGQYNWLMSSKSAGSVAASYSIPQDILDHPAYAMLAQTKYGAKYLQLVIPQLAGNFFTAYGPTKPC
jgi:hypothetical protein